MAIDELKIIDSFKCVFEKFSDLKVLPIYAWGRYYKYELAGDPFDIGSEDGFCRFRHMIDDERLNVELLKEIDKQIRQDDELVNKLDSVFENLAREDCVETFNFDKRGGRALIIIKENELFKIECITCDSPE